MPERLHITGISQEPYGTYHFASLLSESGISFTHLVPDMRNLPTLKVTGLAITDDEHVLAHTDLLLVEGGSLNERTNEISRQANDLNIPVVFIELAYPGGTPKLSHPTFRPDLVIATNLSSVPYYAQLFGIDENEIVLCLPPMLESLQVSGLRTEHPSILLISSVSAELPDKGETLQRFARALKERRLDFTVRLHPRENTELWLDYKVAEGTVNEQLDEKWAILGYQGTFYAYANYAGIPAYHIAEEPWMSELLPKNWAVSFPVHTPENFITLITLDDEQEDNITAGARKQFSEERVLDALFQFWDSQQSTQSD